VAASAPPAKIISRKRCSQPMPAPSCSRRADASHGNFTSSRACRSVPARSPRRVQWRATSTNLPAASTNSYIRMSPSPSSWLLDVDGAVGAREPSERALDRAQERAVGLRGRRHRVVVAKYSFPAQFRVACGGRKRRCRPNDRRDEGAGRGPARRAQASRVARATAVVGAKLGRTSASRRRLYASGVQQRRRANLAARPLCGRWTNGDPVARNVPRSRCNRPGSRSGTLRGRLQRAVGLKPLGLHRNRISPDPFDAAPGLCVRAVLVRGPQSGVARRSLRRFALPVRAGALST
jgi:hypothetical protein